MTSYLGMSGFACTLKKFPTKRFLKQYPPNLRKAAIAIMPGSFGWNAKTITQFQEMGFKRIMVEIHIADGPGRRRGNWSSDLYPYGSVKDWNNDLVSKNPKVLKAVQKHMEKLLDWLPDCPTETKRELVICPELEDNLSDEAWTVLANTVRQAIPKKFAKILRNPCTGGRGGKWDLYERHGAFPISGNNVILNSDGMSVDVSDDSSYDNCLSVSSARKKIIEAAKYAHSVMIWHHDQQGWHNVKDWNISIPALERDCWVTDGCIETFKSIFKDAAGL